MQLLAIKSQPFRRKLTFAVLNVSWGGGDLGLSPKKLGLSFVSFPYKLPFQSTSYECKLLSTFPVVARSCWQKLNGIDNGAE